MCWAYVHLHVGPPLDHHEGGAVHTHQNAFSAQKMFQITGSLMGLGFSLLILWIHMVESTPDGATLQNLLANLGKSGSCT